MSPIYDNDDVTPPIGHNNMYVPHQMLMRLYYKNNIYPEDGVNPIDLWYGRPFYGKVDTEGRTVHLSETHLKQFTRTDLFAADFVVDAFEDFHSELKIAIQRTNLPSDSFLKTIRPIRAWTSPGNLYHVYFSNLHGAFVDSYIKNEKGSIKNFEDYFKFFMEYVYASTNSLPFSRSSFILSRFCSPLTSGMMVDLAPDGHGNDFVKFTKYINTNEFECYRNTAAKFGFFVDKNAPWRLIANIASPEMKEYIKQSTCSVVVEDPWDFGDGNAVDNFKMKERIFDCEVESTEELFSVYYYPTSKYDYESFKIYLFQSYNTFAGAFPEYENWKYCFSKKETQVSFGEREIFVDRPDSKAYDIFTKQYDDLFWLPVYFSVLAAEARIKMDSRRRKKTLKRLRDIYKISGLQKAIDFIEKQTKIPAIYSAEGTQDKFVLDY